MSQKLRSMIFKLFLLLLQIFQSRCTGRKKGDNNTFLCIICPRKLSLRHWEGEEDFKKPVRTNCHCLTRYTCPARLFLPNAMSRCSSCYWLFKTIDGCVPYSITQPGSQLFADIAATGARGPTPLSNGCEYMGPYSCTSSSSTASRLRMDCLKMYRLLMIPSPVFLCSTTRRRRMTALSSSSSW